MATYADAQELTALRSLSASIGSNPHLTQAAGGNTSLKSGDTLWIKASGTWLKDAVTDDIMMPVAMAPLLRAVEQRDSAAEQPQTFAIEALNPRKLRPSIETSVHALMPQRNNCTAKNLSARFSLTTSIRWQSLPTASAASCPRPCCARAATR